MEEDATPLRGSGPSVPATPRVFGADAGGATPDVPVSSAASQPSKQAAPAPDAVSSRQSLVVPPRATRPFVAIFGAAVCAAAGFALVWWTGLGRTATDDTTAPEPPAIALAGDASTLPPQPFQFASDGTALARALPSPPLAGPDGLTEVDEGMAREMPPRSAHGSSAFATRTVPVDPAADDDVPMARDGDSPVARAAFESADDSGDAAADDVSEEGHTEEAATADAPTNDVDRSVAQTRFHAPMVTASDDAADAEGDAPGPARPPLSAFSANASAGEPGTAAPPMPFPVAASAPPDPALDDPALNEPAFDDPEAPVPVPAGVAGSPAGRGTRAETTGSAPLTGTTTDRSDGLRESLPAPPRGPESPPSTDGARGFGMAPPLGPTPAFPPRLPDADPTLDAVDGPPTALGSQRTPGEAAQQTQRTPGEAAQQTQRTPGEAAQQTQRTPGEAARPGPLQLEGVQTPQVALEKRGPREVQVGKVARYETILRNVGAAIARDVTLHDAVPAGTRLVSTVPPASPDARGGLVWQLGDLPQGGEARVAMELMPVEEGEVGSVASVAFRADASVRSLATRPDLRIEVQPPKPVLVGSAVDMSIVLSNPGTGEATGIVLEGILPEALAHAAGREVEFDVGRLRPGESRRIDLRLSSKSPGTHPLRLVARADAGIEVEEPLRVTITAPTLELTADIPGRRYLQRPATCILSMANGGTAPARSVELAAQVPQGMKFVRANNAGTYDESTHRVIWHLEELPPGEVGSVELVLMPVALGPQRIAVAARALDGLADQLVESIDVEGLAALAFQVSDSEDPVEVGGLTEYVVRVGNQGTKPASGVRVTVSLLGDLEPVEASGPVRYRVENLSIVFDPLASLAPAEESVFRVRARGRRAGDQRVQVQVTSTDTGTPITKEEVTRVYADD